MIQCGSWPVGVCSWSLGNEPDALQQVREQTGVEHMHLCLDPITTGSRPELSTYVKDTGWTITCGMVAFEQEDYSTLETIKRTGGIVPDDAWPANRRRIMDSIALAGEMGIKQLSFHFGFIELKNTTLAERIGELADAAAAEQITLLMETGQETAAELGAFLEKLNHPALGVNFDPANMILYGKGDPVAAVATLAPWIHHVHIKDALASAEPGQWGQEVPWTQGQVPTADFLRALKTIGFDGALAIEREAGASRLADIDLAMRALAGFEG